MLLSFVCTWLLSSTLGVAGETDIIERKKDGRRRPVWNIAHMTNDIEIVKTYLNDGANALEFDIEFNKKGEPLRTYHGFPCDCCRRCFQTEKLPKFLDKMKNFTTPGHLEFREQLVLLMLDLKVKVFDSSLALEAGENIATVLLDYYWQRGRIKPRPRAYIVLSIPSLAYAKLIRGFYNKLTKEGFEGLRRKVGVDFSNNDNLEDVYKTLKKLNIRRRVWQSDGVTNCVSRGTSRLEEAIKMRDDRNYKFIDKVYYWSVDRKSTMRKVLNLTVDGMITNYPDNFVSVLNEREFASRFRLATYEDYPWRRFTPSRSRMIEESSVEQIGQINAKEPTDNMLVPKGQNFIIPAVVTGWIFSCVGKEIY